MHVEERGDPGYPTSGSPGEAWHITPKPGEHDNFSNSAKGSAEYSADGDNYLKVRQVLKLFVPTSSRRPIFHSHRFKTDRKLSHTYPNQLKFAQARSARIDLS